MQLAPNVHTLRIPFIVPIGGAKLERFVNCYVILGRDTWVVDAGVKGSAQAILRLVCELGRSAQSVRHILLTHGHADHLGGARELVERTGAQLYAHPAERHWIERVEEQARQRPVPGFFDLVGGSVTIDHELADGQVFELMPDLQLRVMHVPGHSPGNCAFFLEQPKLLLAGDAVPVPTDMPVYDDPLLSARSLAKLRVIRMVRTLSSAWDDPKTDAAVDVALKAGSDFLEAMHRAVVEQPEPTNDAQQLRFCTAVLSRVGLPKEMANPMVQRTLAGHLAHRHRPSLLG